MTALASQQTCVGRLAELPPDAGCHDAPVGDVGFACDARVEVSPAVLDVGLYRLAPLVRHALHVAGRLDLALALSDHRIVGELSAQQQGLRDALACSVGSLEVRGTTGEMDLEVDLDTPRAVWDVALVRQARTELAGTVGVQPWPLLTLCPPTSAAYQKEGR